MAPEVFNKKYSTKADVYSFAVMMYETIVREVPYKNETTISIAKNVSEGKRPEIKNMPKDVPYEVLE